MVPRDVGVAGFYTKRFFWFVWLTHDFFSELPIRQILELKCNFFGNIE